MKVLWITNIVLPEALELLTGDGSLKSSGGWLIGLSKQISKQVNVNLAISTVSKKVNKITRLSGQSITYYLIPYGKGNYKINHKYDSLWKEVYEDFKPDVVHLHGTEFSHGLSFLNACGSDNVCVSIQGLVSVYCNYYCSGLSYFEILKSFTLNNIIRGGIFKGRNSYIKRGELEKEIIRRSQNIIGRTSWDKEHVWAINPKAHYHYGGEILRPEFYSAPTWLYDTCTPHSIFLSQAFYPIKGLHMVLRAMPLVLRHYPDATIRVAGPDIARMHGGKRIIMISDYGLIIRRLIKKYQLRNCVTFTGALDAEGMKREYLRCNVFISPSSIENSPNSIGEAQLLGVPIIASYVGGVMDMMRGYEEYLYRFEEVEMLASKICSLFKKRESISTVTMREIALQRHNPETIVSNLIETYQTVIEG